MIGDSVKMNNPSSFSSISFDAETAKRFKELAKEQNKTHTELMQILFDCYKYCLDRKNELME